MLEQCAEAATEKAVRERRSPAAHEVFETIRQEGEQELGRSSWALAFSGLAAGLSMGFSMLSQALVSRVLPDAEWADAIATLGYATGFVIVVLGRQQLFTENTLTPILPLLEKRTRAVGRDVLRLWSIVLATNLLGAFLFAWSAAASGAFDESLQVELRRIGAAAVDRRFGQALVQGVYAGWLIALMVWLLPFAETWRFMVIVMLTSVVGLADLPHIIAGSVDAFYAVMVGAAGLGDALWHFFVPTLIGNIIGGSLLVAVLNYAQAARK